VFKIENNFISPMVVDPEVLSSTHTSEKYRIYFYTLYTHNELPAYLCVLKAFPWNYVRCWLL